MFEATRSWNRDSATTASTRSRSKHWQRQPRLHTTDEQLLKALVRRKKSPRIIIEAESKISGISVQPDVVSVLREMALAYQLQVVDRSVAADANARRARRDRLVGEGGE